LDAIVGGASLSLEGGVLLPFATNHFGPKCHLDHVLNVQQRVWDGRGAVRYRYVV
jgi:hypothetical protein